MNERVNYRGVGYHRRDGHFLVKIKSGGRVFYLKTYHSAEVAARVYDAAAVILHGPQAKLNFDGQPPPSIPRARVRQWLIEAGAIRPTT